MVLITPVIDIALIALLVAVISRTLQWKMIGRDKMKQQQQSMKEKQKRLKELMKKERETGDEKTRKEIKKEIDELNQIMLEEMSEMMKGNMRFMLVSFIVIIPIFFLGVSGYSGETFPIGSFTVPVINWYVPPYIVWYIICSIAISIVFSIIFKIYDKTKEKKKEK